MNEVAVDWEFEQQAVESQLSRPAPVCGCTGTLGWRACTAEKTDEFIHLSIIGINTDRQTDLFISHTVTRESVKHIKC